MLLRNISNYFPNIFESKKIKNTIFSLLGLFIFQFINALVVLLIARKISTLEYGQLVSVKAFINIIIVLASFGYDSWFLANANFFDDYKYVWLNLIKNKLKLHILFFIFSFVIVHFYFDDQTYPSIIFILLGISLILDSFLQSIFTFQRVEGKFDTIFYVQICYSIFLLIAVLFIPNNNFSFILFCLLKLIISFLSLIYGIFMMKRNYKLQSLNIKLPKFSKLDSKSFFIADISAIIYEKIDIFIISFFLGVNGTMIYGPAVNIIFFTFFLPNAIYFVVLPLLTRNYRNFKNQEVNNFVKNSIFQLIVQLSFGILMSLLIFFFSHYIIKALFGNSYLASVDILKRLAIIPFIKFGNFGLGAILTSSKKQDIRTNIMISSAIINFLLNLILVKTIGLDGAIISYIISELFLLISYSYYSINILRKKV